MRVYRAPPAAWPGIQQSRLCILPDLPQPCSSAPPCSPASSGPDPAKLAEAVRIRDLLGRNTEELRSVARALNGEYILPEAGGDLLRDGAGALGSRGSTSGLQGWLCVHGRRGTVAGRSVSMLAAWFSSRVPCMRVRLLPCTKVGMLPIARSIHSRDVVQPIPTMRCSQSCPSAVARTSAAGVLPTGRNIHAMDPYRMPSLSAMDRGAKAAEAILQVRVCSAAHCDADYRVSTGRGEI